MQRYQDCRICGKRLRFEDALNHETQCLRKSYENTTTGTDLDIEKGSETDDSEDKEDMSVAKKVSFVDDDDDDIDHLMDMVYNPQRAFQNEPPLHPSSIKSRSSKDLQTRKKVRSPGCHDHNSKYSGRRASMPYDRTKPENLFPPTKKYHYYPVTCEYCWKRYQPNELKDHQRKQHFGEKDDGPRSKRTQSSAIQKGYTEEHRRSGPSKSVGAIPRRLQICYICGRMYGSKSLKIHEPKCLDKWRIQNDQLPPDRRAPEPVKREPLQVSSGTESLPEFNPVAEAAFLSHLDSLIPCTHCSRTFSPDRIIKHESCCIERPKRGIRECKTPTDGKIER